MQWLLCRNSIEIAINPSCGVSHKLLQSKRRILLKSFHSKVPSSINAT